jgi:hypothetical protein
VATGNKVKFTPDRGGYHRALEIDNDTDLICGLEFVSGDGVLRSTVGLPRRRGSPLASAPVSPSMPYAGSSPVTRRRRLWCVGHRALGRPLPFGQIDLWHLVEQVLSGVPVAQVDEHVHDLPAD